MKNGAKFSKFSVSVILWNLLFCALDIMRFTILALPKRKMQIYSHIYVMVALFIYCGNYLLFTKSPQGKEGKYVYAN